MSNVREKKASTTIGAQAGRFVNRLGEQDSQQGKFCAEQHGRANEQAT